MDTNLMISLESLIKYYSNENVTSNIEKLQRNLQNKNKESIKTIIEDESTNVDILKAALEVKSVIGQINVIIHALGIINTLPYILEDNEVIENISLGADNANSSFNLITNKRIAKFKFITWKGNDSMRLKTTFADYYNLVEADTEKERYLYLTDCSYFIKFLNGKRSLSNILNRNTKINNEFKEKYGDRYTYVNEYYNDNKSKVRFVSLKDELPEIFK